MPWLAPTKTYVIRAIKQFGWTDLRWAHLWIALFIISAGFINVLLPDGWTIWPLIPVMAALVVINEAADRNDQGVPPLQVYGFVVIVVMVWILGVVIMSKVHILIQLLGVGGVVWYAVDGWMKVRRRMQIIEMRRQAGCCIHCGHECDPYDTLCGECGREPDPGRTEAQRTAAIVRHGKGDGHARGVLKPESYAASAARKEKELLAKADQRRGRIRKR